jgi:apoptosis-inducing factor 2
MTKSRSGKIPNSKYFKNSFSKYLNERGYVNIKESFQIKHKNEEIRNIFAIGDIVNLKEEKTAFNSRYHSEIVCFNIENFESTKNIKLYKEKHQLITLSLGMNLGMHINGDLVKIDKKLMELRKKLLSEFNKKNSF